jgi:hypothetical protein
MKCDECGRTFPGNQATQDYRYDRGSDQDNWKVPMTICPDCAAGRAVTLRWFVWFFVVLVVSGSLIVAVAKLFKAL